MSRGIKNKKKLNEERIEYYYGLPQKLYEWAVLQGYKIVVEENYFIIEDGDYRIMYSKVSRALQCYYLGFGYDCKEARMRDFDKFSDVLKYIKDCREMEIIIGSSIEDMTMQQKTHTNWREFYEKKGKLLP